MRMIVWSSDVCSSDLSRAAMPARRMRGPSAHQTGPSPSQTRVGVHKNVWPAGTTGTSANQRIMRFLITLSYTRTMCLSPAMDEDPERNELAVAIEFWALTAFVLGALFYGILRGVGSLLG